MKPRASVRLLAVIERDLKKFRRNPVVLAMSVVMPILYLLILGNSFQGKLRALPLAVVDHDAGPSARQVVDNLQAVAAGPQTFTMVRIDNQQSAIDGVREGVYKGALIIPADFSKRLTIRARPVVGLFVDNTDGISAAALQGVVAGALNSIHSEYVPVREPTDEVLLRKIDLYRSVDYFQSLVPGVVIMAIFLGSLTTGAFNLVMDRFLGVDESYLLTPLTKMDIVAGLILSGLTITTLIAGLIFAVSIAITGIPLANPLPQCLAILVVVDLTTLGLLSLMFVFLGRLSHPRVVGILSGFLNVILFFPSGAVYPIASFPPWLRAFARVNPEAYAVHALKSILFKGSGFGPITHDLLFLAVFTVVMLGLAVLVFKRTI